MKKVGKACAYDAACPLGIEREGDERDMPYESFEWFGPRYQLEEQVRNTKDVKVRGGSLNNVRERAMRLRSWRSYSPRRPSSCMTCRTSLSANIWGSMMS